MRSLRSGCPTHALEVAERGAGGERLPPQIRSPQPTALLAAYTAVSAGGELFDLIQKAKRFTEDDARYFFQQLICGVEYLHDEGITHRDIKLENTLLGGPRPLTLLKICDFGYSKSAEVERSKCKSTVGTPAYLAPEMLDQRQYDGPGVDVWSCGVMLYVMLVGSYPFEDPQDRCAGICSAHCYAASHCLLGRRGCC